MFEDKMQSVGVPQSLHESKTFYDQRWFCIVPARESSDRLPVWELWGHRDEQRRDLVGRSRSLAALVGLYQTLTGNGPLPKVLSDTSAIGRVRLPTAGDVQRAVADFAAEMSLKLMSYFEKHGQTVPGFPEDGYFYSPFRGFSGWTAFLCDVGRRLDWHVRCTSWQAAAKHDDWLDWTLTVERLAERLLEVVLSTLGPPTTDVVHDLIVDVVDQAWEESDRDDEPEPVADRGDREPVDYARCEIRRCLVIPVSGSPDDVAVANVPSDNPGDQTFGLVYRGSVVQYSPRLENVVEYLAQQLREQQSAQGETQA